MRYFYFTIDPFCDRIQSKALFYTIDIGYRG